MRKLLLLLFLVLGIVSAPVHGTTYLVKPDGTGDFYTIQEAVEAASDGDVIELANGIFTGECNCDIDYQGKSITVTSQSRNPKACIIDCGGDVNPHRGFIFVSGEDEDAVLEGVTIRNGDAHGRF
jgi:hypothetical protein